MIWHILKKDFRLLWPLIALVAAVHVGNAALLASGGQFAPGSVSDGHSVDFGWISNSALPFVGLLGLVVVVIAVFQQDRLPGTTQDWLTRPIPRGQMLAAKILLIALAGLTPILLSDISLGLAEKLRLGDVLAASLRRTAGLACFICLPAVMIAIVTRSLTEALLFTLAVVVAVLIESTVFSKPMTGLPLLMSGLAWTIGFVLLVANVVATVVMLRLQLQWRSTNRVRWLALAYLCASPAVLMLPWSVGFGLQRALTHDSERLPGVVRLETSPRMTFSIPVGPHGESKGNAPYVSVIVPVTMPTGTGGLRWSLDHAQADLIDPANGRSTDGQVSLLLMTRIREGKPTLVLQAAMPLGAFQLARQRHTVVRATLFLTSLQPLAKRAVASLDGGGIDEFSRCDRTEEDVVRCISTRPVGTCIGVLYGANQRGHSKRSFSCPGISYAPWTLPLWRDPYYTYTSGDADWGDQRSAREGTVLWTYKPGAHFAQQVEFTLDRTEQESGSNHSVDGRGIAVRFANPGGMVADSRGNLFVVDTTDSIVRKVSPSGEVTTYAGQKGNTGRNDGQRDVARFNSPAAIAVDAVDNLYIADTGNALIRKISAEGVVSTVAGNGMGPGDAESGIRFRHLSAIVYTSEGNLYVVDYSDNDGSSIRKVLPNGTITTVAGPETEVGLSDEVVERAGGGE